MNNILKENEKVHVIKGAFAGEDAVIQLILSDGLLWVTLNNGRKTAIESVKVKTY